MTARTTDYAYGIAMKIFLIPKLEGVEVRNEINRNHKTIFVWGVEACQCVTH